MKQLYLPGFEPEKLVTSTERHMQYLQEMSETVDRFFEGTAGELDLLMIAEKYFSDLDVAHDYVQKAIYELHRRNYEA